MLALNASAEDGAITIDASACVDIRSHIERLTCYDELVDAANHSARSVTSPEPDEMPVTAVQSSSVEAVDTEQKPTLEKTIPVKAATSVASTGSTAAVTEVTTVTSAPTVTEENFGLKEKKKNNDEDVVELISKITALNERLPNRYLITLENDQVWWQKVGSRYQMQVGDEVRIYPSRWGGAYRLTVVDQSGFIQVERVK